MNSTQPPLYLATILNSIDSAILVVDAYGKIIDCNNAVYKVFSYTCKEIKNKLIYDLCAVTPEIMYYENSSIISSGIKKNSTHFFCEITIHTLDINKQEKNFLFIISDVHERETNKLALQKAIEITASNFKLAMGIV